MLCQAAALSLPVASGDTGRILGSFQLTLTVDKRLSLGTSRQLGENRPRLGVTFPSDRRTPSPMVEGLGSRAEQ